jgi:cyclic-di-GMP phosphodiesterase TipF (flagellum assembly factor)
LYLVYLDKRHESALVGAVLLLGLSQLLSVRARGREAEEQREEIDGLRRSHDGALREATVLRSRIDAMEKQADRPVRETRETGNVTEEMERVRREVLNLTQDFFASPGPPQPAAPVSAAPVAAAAAPAPPSRPKPAFTEEQLDLYLEPIVSLETNATAHYRAAMWLRPGTSHPVGGDDLYQSAERGGLRPALDVFALTRVLPVLRRLTAKGRKTSIFVPVGRATLAATPYLDEMIRLLNGAPDVAQHVVLEIEHRAIANLNDAGIQGLAHLGRSGASLGLGGAAATGIEFAALLNLGFRTIEFAAGPAANIPAWLNAARIASSQGMEVLVGGVERPEQVETIRRWAHFASGPHFAPPRLVRSDLGAEPLRARAA